MVRTYDALRVGPFDEVRYAAWLDGQTGYPMVDACMRSLHHTGWLNFRMRCMLVSFACYQLWLDWRRLTPAMARLFLDYEPGIHYPQFQMQAGTTGINANRIYSASKQAEDHAGPGYEFIRRWVPELKDVPNQYMAEPHLMPREVQLASGCVVGKDYPPPIVDSKESYKFAVAEFARVRALAETKAQSAEVYEKHGSCKRPAPSGGSSGGRADTSAEGKRTATAAATDAPFAVETAASGRANCRQCGDAIAKGAHKVSVSAWSRGGRISANHHLGCFVAGLRVEASPSNRGKCKHCACAFVKGTPRIGYSTTGADELAWLCLESASALLPPLFADVEHWSPEHTLKGYDALPCELQAQVKRALCREAHGI